MPTMDFLNSAANLAYPCKPGYAAFGAYTLGFAVILDAEIIWGPASGYAYTIPTQLTSIVADATNITYTVTAGSLSIAFVVPRSAGYGQVVYASAAGGPDVGTGFLQVGNVLPISNGTYTGTAALEETRVQNNYRHQVSTINVANHIATLWTSADCLLTYVPVSQYVVAVTGLTGDVYLSPGRFVAMSQQTEAGTLLFWPTATQASGGDPNSTAAALEVVPGNYTLAGSAPKCNELVTALNGVTSTDDANLFLLQGSRGFTIALDGTNANQLNITLDQAALFRTTS